MDFEKELTCSICTELLYQPLTLLDCLHTFCGACLKEWFSFQANAYENSPLAPPPPGTPIYTCPSCRAAVRDTKHNATVATLLDMFIANSPDRDRDAAEKADLATKYSPGEKVLREVRPRGGRTAQERLDIEQDRRLMDQVRQLSLQEAGVASQPAAAPSAGSSATHRHHHRRRTEDGSDSDRARHSRRPVSRDTRTHRHREESAPRSAASSGDHLHPHHSRMASASSGAAREDRHQQRHRSTTRRQSDGDSTDDDVRHPRQVEHQSSLRSLISSNGMSEEQIAREVEELVQQIQEEGLLNGLDMENMDANGHSELSRRVLEAYQRKREKKERERERSRRIEARRAREERREASRPPRSVSAHRDRDRDRDASRSRRSSEDRSRPPPAPSAAHHLEVVSDTRRRRATSTGNGATRTATDPISNRPLTASSENRAGRSQTDLTIRTQRAAQSQSGSGTPTGVLSPRERQDSLPSSSGMVTSPRERTDSLRPVVDSPHGEPSRSFASRLPQVTVASASAPQTPAPSARRGSTQRPAESLVSAAHPIGAASLSSPSLPANHQRSISQPTVFSPQSPVLGSSPFPSSVMIIASVPPPTPEPSITCSRCDKPNIQYDLHYNCGICKSGAWNVCMLCYRKGRGCNHWFGFGYTAWRKWDRERQNGNPTLEKPHMLTACRYRRPVTGTRPAGTAPEPVEVRLESGCFCSRCHTKTNECFWRCEICNDGDWGYCNTCVNTGRRCDHQLLPLTYQPSLSALSEGGVPTKLPRWASLLTGPEATPIGSFQPLTFHKNCNLCAKLIMPTITRMHCFQCVGAAEDGGLAGDYDICTECYASLSADGTISPQNGASGWRRCPQGHRMIIEAYTVAKGGERRFTLQDLVGGAMLKLAGHPGSKYLQWTAKENGQDVARNVSRTVSEDVPDDEQEDGVVGSVPRDKSLGGNAVARWSWFGQEEQADDELYFPRGASLKEVEVLSEEWCFGVYMDESGLFPANYAVIDGVAR